MDIVERETTKRKGEKMNEVVIVDGVRTPVGNFGGSLKNHCAYDLGALVLQEVLKRTKIETTVRMRGYTEADTTFFLISVIFFM